MQQQRKEGNNYFPCKMRTEIEWRGGGCGSCSLQEPLCPNVLFLHTSPLTFTLPTWEYGQWASKPQWNLHWNCTALVGWETTLPYISGGRLDVRTSLLMMKGCVQMPFQTQGVLGNLELARIFVWAPKSDLK